MLRYQSNKGLPQQYFTWENDSYKAQNNFWMVAGHNDQPKKFFLGQVLFLTGQNIYRKELLMTLPPYKLKTIICLYKSLLDHLKSALMDKMA